MSDLDAEIAAAQQSRGVGLASADADDEFIHVTCGLYNEYESPAGEPAKCRGEV